MQQGNKEAEWAPLLGISCGVLLRTTKIVVAFGLASNSGNNSKKLIHGVCSGVCGIANNMD